jgi:hypothetical protein
MAWTKKQSGLRKPANWTAQMRAVDREDLELIAFDMPHPARSVRGLAIGRANVWMSKGRQACLALRKLAGGAKRHPGAKASAASASHSRQNESNGGYRKNCPHKAVEQNSQLRQDAASR